MIHAQIVKDEPAVYFGREALSQSGMTQLLRCPAHFRAMLDRAGEPEEQTDALLAGSLLHCMVLEPGALHARYAIRQNAGNTKAGKEEAAQAEASGVRLVKADMWDVCERMAESVREHPLMRAALAEPDFAAESSVYWTELDGRVPCKARIDALASLPGFGLCAIDLKTTRDASPAALEKSIHAFSYHRQAAWYMRGLRAAGCGVRAFIFLFVEKEPPFLTVAASISEAAQQVALDEIKTCVHTYADCIESGIWPGYTESPVIELDLPAWAYRRKDA
ncbi:MAG TPA: PD-(D/E)XK nuclease-like domain-containing protein [Candidatus Desulfovibrio gallistercoris]|nr:PD-(D/E)XK nuclease-like domain-containing protein [Candidatus Desulfovibrio gallistercoris]